MLYKDITETIGDTPLVMVNRMAEEGTRVALKLESFNPMSSAKDRIGLNMILEAERQGKIRSMVTELRDTLQRATER